MTNIRPLMSNETSAIMFLYFSDIVYVSYSGVSFVMPSNFVQIDIVLRMYS